MSFITAKEKYMMTGWEFVFRIAVLSSIVVVSACETPINTDVAAPAPTSTSASPSAVAVPPLAVETADKDQVQAIVDPSRREVAVVAGGCFWGMEDILRDIPGVLETDVGYTGGGVQNPRYEDVKKGKSGHAESVRITFDPSVISYSDLLEKWFFRMHDPTTKNRQGNDVGAQYRSAIFYGSETQKDIANAVIQKVNKSEQWDDPIVTEVVPAGEFTSAEDYHQDYLEKNPGGYTCHYMRESTL
jgi:peptide methionine sulfoxide reductase msrA/msrB